MAIDRSYKKRKNVLFSKLLVTIHPEDEAAKLFMEFMKEHPELSIHDTFMEIETEEVEEDYYGNGGGYEHRCRVYQWEQESQQEHDGRIKEEKDKILGWYLNEVRKLTRNLVRELGIKENPDEEYRDVRAAIDGMLDFELK